MIDRSRRDLLVALAGTTTLAGCGGRESSPTPSTSVSGQPTESPSSTPAASPTPTESSTATPAPVDATDFEYVGSVVRQPSEAAPGKIRASLTNRTGRTLTITGGGPFPTSTAVDSEAETPLVLLPDRDDRANDYFWNYDDPVTADIDDVSYDGDCWRAPAWVMMTAAQDGATVPNDLTAAADLYPLAGPNSDCPAGTYTVEVSHQIDETDQFFRAKLTVEITTDQRFSVTGSLSEAPS